MSTATGSPPDLAAFGTARADFIAAMGQVPPAALPYLRPGDDYSLGGLAVHVNFVLEHYLNVLRAMVESDFAECRPEDPAGLEETARRRARSGLPAEEVKAELDRTARLHREVEATLISLGGDRTRQAPVRYPGSAEPYPTSPADVLEWLTGHYREHVPQIRELVTAWRLQEDSAEALAVVERFNAAFGRGDVDGIMGLMTEDCVFENTYPPPDGERHAGQAAVRSFWTRFFSGTERPRFEAEEVFAAGDRVVARWRFSWGGPGSSGHVRGVDVFRIRDGKVAEKLAYVKG